MHYVVVIGVLPKWKNGYQSRIANSFFTWLVVFFSTLLFVSFTISFINSRALYGIIAAVHAWVEIPILLLALVIPENSTMNTESLSKEQLIN
jgi:hypothetical protein